MAVESVNGVPARSTRQSSGATPARSTRAVSAAQQGTPGARRSARAAPKQLQPSSQSTKNAIANPALPEIHTRQSYAYGSSKAPQLPDQLRAPMPSSLKQLVGQMDSAVHQARRNLEGHVTDVDLGRASTDRWEEQRDLRLDADEGKRQKGTTPSSQTTDMQKQQRTAAWAHSIDSDQLENIPEEEQSVTASPVTRITEPSSFPSGIFDYSYNYERGIRAPHVERRSRLQPLLKGSLRLVASSYHVVGDFSKQTLRALRSLLSRLHHIVQQSVFELVESSILPILVKTIFFVFVSASLSLIFCLTYRNYLCDSGSTSSISVALQNVCGLCTASSYSPTNFSLSNGNDIKGLTAALKSINARISTIETRLGDRDSKYAGVQSEVQELRRQQSDLTHLLENLGHANDVAGQIASPLIPKINFFSFPNGALVLNDMTSPTLTRQQALPIRIFLSMTGLNRRSVNGPYTALMAWQDVGDCWCASASGKGQDKMRLGVRTRELIYPTELVIEHAPRGSTLTSDTAPRNVELWADFSHLSMKQWQDLGIEQLLFQSKNSPDALGYPWVKIGSGVYEYSRESTHLQRFKLDVNQFGELRHHSQKFVVRGRTNHGADYGCLYRVRLHGVPQSADFEETERKFDRQWYHEKGYEADSEEWLQG